MSDRTTISITRDLKDTLDKAKKREQESYEDVIWRLLCDQDPNVSALADKLVAELPKRTADELEGRLNE